MRHRIDDCEGKKSWVLRHSYILWWKLLGEATSEGQRKRKLGAGIRLFPANKPHKTPMLRGNWDARILRSLPPLSAPFAPTLDMGLILNS